MIQSVEILYFKGFKYKKVDLKSYNVLVGPNASGKSTFIDVLKLIKDVLNDGPIGAVEKRSSNFLDLTWNKAKTYFEFALEFKLPSTYNHHYRFSRYELAINQDTEYGICISNEQLWLIKDEKSLKKGYALFQKTAEDQLERFPYEFAAPDHLSIGRRKSPAGWRKIFSKNEKGTDYFRSETTDWNITYRFGPHKASLARIPEDETRFPISLWVKQVLMEGIEYIHLNSEAMRWPCRPDAPTMFKPDGSNLPKVLKSLRMKDEEKYKMWVNHVKTALYDIKDIIIRERPEDRFLYVSIRYQNGIDIPSWLLSDGTLRLLALTLIPYLPVKNKVFLIEAPENGLHPTAIETVIQSLSSSYENVIFVATHSPIVLRLASPEDILCFSKTESGTIDVIRGDQHPRLKDWKKDIDLATLHAAGVLQ